MTLRRTRAVAGRVLLQIVRDRRFLVVLLVAPVMLIFFVKTLFDATTIPPQVRARFVVPFGAYIVHFLTYILTAIVLVRERVAQTLERMFVNGYRQAEIVTGYVLGYTVLATVVSLILLTALQGFFDLGYGLSRLAEVYVVIWLLALISMSLGILVSNVARTEAQVIPFIPLVIIPSFLFSGIVVAVDLLPTWAQVVSRFSPMYYANEILQPVITGGSITDDVGSLVALPLFVVGILVLATFTLRER